MPVCKLEYTENMALSNAQLKAFFLQLHHKMVEVIGTDLATCKSVAEAAKDYLIADGKSDEAYLMLEIKALPGRTDEQLQTMKKEAAALLHELIETVDCQLPTAVRVLITETNLPLYWMSDANK